MPTMELYVTRDSYNVIAFDKAIAPRPESITLAGEIICPGDKITAILGKNSSAGFGSFSMKSGFITYVGKHTIKDERGECEYVLFGYDFPHDADGTIDGHKVAYVCWVSLEEDGETYLFYEGQSHSSGRLIWPKAVRRYMCDALDL